MLGRWNSVEVGGFLIRIQSTPSCGNTYGVVIQIAYGNTDYYHPPNANIPPQLLVIIISY